MRFVPGAEPLLEVLSRKRMQRCVVACDVRACPVLGLLEVPRQQLCDVPVPAVGGGHPAPPDEEPPAVSRAPLAQRGAPCLGLPCTTSPDSPLWGRRSLPVLASSRKLGWRVGVGGGPCVWGGLSLATGLTEARAARGPGSAGGLCWPSGPGGPMCGQVEAPGWMGAVPFPLLY